MEDLLLGGVDLDDDEEENDEEEVDNNHKEGMMAKNISSTTILPPPPIQSVTDTGITIPGQRTIEAMSNTINTMATLPPSSSPQGGSNRSGSAFSSPNVQQQQKLSSSASFLAPAQIVQPLSAIPTAITAAPSRTNTTATVPVAIPLFGPQDDFEPMPFFPETTASVTHTAAAAAAAAATPGSMQMQPLHLNQTSSSSFMGVSNHHMPPPPPPAAATTATSSLMKPIRRNALQLSASTTTASLVHHPTTTNSILAPTPAITTTTNSGTVSTTTSTANNNNNNTFKPITAAAPLNDPFLLSHTTATVAPPEAHNTSLLSITNTDDIDSQQKAKKERIVLFTKILMKYLEAKDPTLHTQAKAVIRECAERNRAGDPAYASVSQSMQGRLKGLLSGTIYWSRAEAYLEQFLAKNNSSSSSTTMIPTIPVPASNTTSTVGSSTLEPHHPTTTTTTSSSNSSMSMPPPPSLLPIKGIQTSFSHHTPTTTTISSSNSNNPLASSTSSTSHLVPHHGLPSIQGTYSVPSSTMSTNVVNRTFASSASVGQSISRVSTDTLDAAALEAKKKEELNAKRKIQRKEAAARKKAKLESLALVTTPLNTNVTSSSGTSFFGPSSSTSSSSSSIQRPIMIPNSMGGLTNLNSANAQNNMYPSHTPSSSISGEDLSSSTSSKQTKSKKSRSNTPIISNMSGMVSSIGTQQNNQIPFIATGGSTGMIINDTTMEGDVGSVKASPVTLAKKKKDTKANVQTSTMTTSTLSSHGGGGGGGVSKKVEEKEYYDWMEMLDHATTIHVQSMGLLLGQDTDIKDEEINRSCIRLLEEQGTVCSSLVGAKLPVEEVTSELNHDGIVQDWSQRNLISSRMAWAMLRLVEQDQTMVAQDVSLPVMTISSTPSNVITEPTVSIPDEQYVNDEDSENDYKITPVTEWFNEERAEEDASLALLSEATQIYVKSLLENAIQSAYIRQNVDGIRLWHIQQAAALVSSSSSSSSAASTSTSSSVDTTEPYVEKKIVPPLYLRLGCDVRRQRALFDGNSAKICQRMEEALARRHNTYSKLMITPGANPVELKMYEFEHDVQKHWIEDDNDLSDPKSLLLATSMGALARKPKLPSVAKAATRDAKMFFDIFGGKDYAQSAPLGRMSKNPCVTREDLLGPVALNQTDFLSKYKQRELFMNPYIPW